MIPVRTPTLGKPLSAREVEILGAVSHGLSNIEIAGRLVTSPLTIKSHLHRMAAKIGTGDRAGMVGVGFREGWLR